MRDQFGEGGKGKRREGTERGEDRRGLKLEKKFFSLDPGFTRLGEKRQQRGEEGVELAERLSRATRFFDECGS